VVFDAVEMHGKKQIRRRLEQIELLFQQQRVRTQRYEFPACHDAFDDLADLFVNERLAARDGHHRRAALVNGVQAFLHGQAFVEDRVRIVDLAAAQAGEIAAKQRLEHEHQRVTLASGQPLLEQIRADGCCLSK
jgi:hypothetical protein